MIASDAKFQLLANQMTKTEKAFNERPQVALPSNTIPNPREEVKVIITQSGMTLVRASVPPPPPSSSSSSSKEVERDPESTMDQVHISSSESTARVPSPVIQPAPASKPNEIPERNPHRPPILYPSSELEGCMVLADLELANRLVAYPAGIVEDVFVQVGKFKFPVDFIAVYYDIDPHVPLILGRPFLRMDRALVDVYGKEFILRVGDEKLTFNVDNTLKYPHKHRNESINMIDIIDTTYEDRFPKVFTIQKLIHPLSGSPDPSFDLIVLSITPFADIDLLLIETNAFLALDSIPTYIDDGIYDSEGDILFLENLLKDEPLKTEKLEINPLLGEPSDTFLMRDEEIKFNPLKDIDDPVPIPRVFETHLDSLDSILDTFESAFTNPLFGLDSEYSLNYDNPIFDIQNKESDESEKETIMDEVKINGS
uniref:Reverse transcriptase domain-containing protein n=1 Tax=Tanacetum cinerariifolium TaxID=118510 RepID=A0A699I3U4_TANCI|nr:hypothetical protein [Tanacetum cinerariifolium]